VENDGEIAAKIDVTALDPKCLAVWATEYDKAIKPLVAFVNRLKAQAARQ
jgi:hypothetical protein